MQNPATIEIAGFIMEAPPRFELGNKGFADLCLTTWLWRRILVLARVAGFEPANDGIRIHCLTTWRYPNVVSGSSAFPAYSVRNAPSKQNCHKNCDNPIYCLNIITYIPRISSNLRKITNDFRLYYAFPHCHGCLHCDSH